MGERGGRGSVAMVSEFFTKNLNRKKNNNKKAWGRMAWVSDFFTKNPNLKKKKKKKFCVGGVGGRKSFIFTKNRNLHIFFFFFLMGGGGGGWTGKGSVARE